MKNSALYHTLPTIRKVRRELRRAAQMATAEFKIFRGMLILRDDNDGSILKTRRWRNRLMDTKQQKWDTGQNTSR